MTANQTLIERRKRFIPNGLGMVTPLTAKSGKGAQLEDMEGRPIIDFAAGIGVNSAGHCPKPVVEAIQKQAETLLHTCFMVATYEPYVDLAERLANLFPHGDQTKVMLTTTGAESVENAIKIARQATKRTAIIGYSGAFHGRTMMGMTLTSKISYKRHCGPFAPEVYRLPYPDYYHYSDGLSLDDFVARELRRLEESFTTLIPEDEVAAIIIEPVLGEGGFNVAPKAYLQGLRRICDQHGIMLILDEVQTGFCRTGSWACYQQSEIVPDISTWAKAMGSGLPIGAVIGRSEIMDTAAPGTIGGTYPGNPVACAGALATIDMMEELNLNARSVSIGKKIEACFRELQEKYPAIGDVRGLGSMMAMEFVKDSSPHKPDSQLCANILKTCWDNGLLVIGAGLYKNAIRLLVPLVIEEDLLEQGLNIIQKAVAQHAR